MGSQYHGMGSILFAAWGPVKTVGGWGLGRTWQQVSHLDNPVTLKIVFQKDILNISLSLTVYVHKYCTLWFPPIPRWPLNPPSTEDAQCYQLQDRCGDKTGGKFDLYLI